jgi:hypothetical protein
MKKINLYLLSFIVAVILFNSCGKNGAVGPQGSTGATGAVGPAGPTGANGAPGSVIYSGTTVPPAATGVVGDYYINLSTGLLYGPKTAAGWGAGISLKGPTGATGTPGSQIFSGSGAPASTVGVAGDYYLDKTNFLLYGPKTASGWGAPIALQGPMGNANVKTDTFTVDHGQWVTGGIIALETDVSGGIYQSIPWLSYQRLNNSVTQDVMDNGMVLVYLEPLPNFSPEIWYPLPYQYPDYSLGTYQYNTDFSYTAFAGGVNVGFYFSQPAQGVTAPDLAVYASGITVNYRFKIITVTGQAGVFMAQNHVNLKDYTAVSRALGLWQQDKANNSHFH